MKAKLALVLGSLLFLGLVCMGCPNDGSGTTSNSVKIENITEWTGELGVFVFADLPEGNDMATNTALQSGNINSGSVTVDLVVPRDNTWNSNPDGTPRPKWTGNGEYYVAISNPSGGSWNWNTRKIYKGDGNTPVKVTFSGELVTLDFGKFKTP
jgi:hypothetical protein